MAFSSSTYMSTSANFKMPLEPAPVPSIIRRSSSDEESFVVLGKSLADFDESAISLDRFSEVNSLGVNIIQEAQQLISQELAQMEKQTQTIKTADSEHNIQSKQPDSQELVHREQNAQTFKTADIENSDEHSQQANSENASEHKDELPEMPLAERSIVNSSQDGNKLISIVSFSPSEIVSEELQQKISQLIDENIHLKDTILQNNVSMKAQYERIVAWQEDVQKVHETHKEKFLQAKQYIEALKKENFNLKEEVEKLADALVNIKSENAEEKQQSMKSSAFNIKEFELEAINKKIMEELNAANQKLRENKTTALLEEKLLKYEEELENAYKKIKDLEVMLEKRKSVAEVELEQTIDQIKSVELSKDKETFELEKRLKASEHTISQLEVKINDYKYEIVTLQGILEVKNINLSETYTKYKELEQNLTDVNACKQQLQVDVNNLKAELEESKIEVWRSKSKEAEKEKFYQEQIQSLKASLNSCNTYQASAPSYEIESLRQQLMQSQIALTNCEQNRGVAYAQIEDYKRQVENLSKQLEETNTQGDEVFVWKTQVEIYKADFEAERAAKEAMRQEKDKVSEDLQHLHRRNQQLQEEIEIIRPQVCSDTHPRRSGGHTSTSSGESSWSNQNSTQLYECPKCNFRFHTINACENHVMKCIELEESLP